MLGLEITGIHSMMCLIHFSNYMLSIRLGLIGLTVGFNAENRLWLVYFLTTIVLVYKTVLVV